VTDGRALAWGVLGASSYVATRAVLPAIAASPSSRLVAVASRPFSHYHELLADPDVDAVYIPLPNHLHHEWTIRAAEAGKHVLCEKPLARTAAEAEEMAAACHQAGVVLMEAYMAPFHPRASTLASLVSSGGLGQLRAGWATFTFPLRDPANHRWLPEAGGGALLDLGIYCLGPLVAAAGRLPVEVSARAVRAASGVDASFSGWLDFGDGFTAAFAVSFEAPERQRLELVGTTAAAVVDRAFAAGGPGTTGTIQPVDGPPAPLGGPSDDPYRVMVEHFVAVVRREAEPAWPPSASVALLGLIDRLREAAA
jgi:predicted dehydrogenase